MNRIPVISKPTRRDFLERIRRENEPMLMTGLLSDWPASVKWTPEFFENLGEAKQVRIEFGNVLHESPRFAVWGLGRYLRHLRGMSEPLADDSEHEEGVPYLAYFDIFKTFPGLRKDVDFSFWKGKFTFPVGWIGPAGTYTGLHYDIAPNLFAQFYGEKEFTLYPPEQTPFLYPATKYDIGSVLSEVDARSPDMSAHPLFAHANGVKVRVEAGQVLYTPAGWWHDVLGLETSISISCFGFNAREALLRGIPGAIRHGLHSLGLYRKGNCACHRRSAVRIRSKSGSTS